VVNYLGFAEKAFPGGRVWGVGCGVWGFTDFEVVNYLIFREKVPEFSPRSPQRLALFEEKIIQQTLPNFQGKSTSIFPLITPMPGTF